LIVGWVSRQGPGIRSDSRNIAPVWKALCDPVLVDLLLSILRNCGRHDVDIYKYGRRNLSVFVEVCYEVYLCLYGMGARFRTPSILSIAAGGIPFFSSTQRVKSEPSNSQENQDMQLPVAS